MQIQNKCNKTKSYLSVSDQANQEQKIKNYPKAQEECIIQQLYAAHQSCSLLIIEIFAYIFTVGLLFIVFQWKKEWRFKMFFRIVTIENATRMIVYGPDNDIQIVKLVKLDDKSKLIFSYRFKKYIYCKEENIFIPFGDSVYECKQNEIIESAQNGLSEDQIENSIIRNGLNATDIPDSGLLYLAFERFFSPFFIFQVGSCILWFFNNYAMYSSIILIVSTLSILFQIYEERSNFNRIKRFSHFHAETTVIRNSVRQIKTSQNIAYGEVVVLKEGDTAPCDLVLVKGSVIVNESMLTGESVSIIKSPIANINTAFTENRQNVIYGGSIIMMVSNAQLVAIRIGFDTLKGNLIRSILYPKSHNQISFTGDTIKFFGILFGVALIQFFVALPTFLDNLDRGIMDIGEIIRKAFDLITISVPPELPTCLSFGISFSLNRLRRKNIFCINPGKINICGIVQSICFDKTGTLTEDYLSFKLVSSYSQDSNSFEDQFTQDMIKQSTKQIQGFSKIQRQIIASCHSIMIYQNEFIGDPLDIEMFKASSYSLLQENYQMQSNNQNIQKQHLLTQKIYFEGQEVLQELTCQQNLGLNIQILQRFQFDADVQRMSVIVQIPHENQRYIFTKGSPECIQNICKPATVPNDYKSKLQQFTNQGYRVLALAYRNLEQVSSQNERNELECEETFAGFLVFENKLKPETTDSIDILQRNDVQIRMVTGDNPETSLSVAKQCGILNIKKQIFLLDYQEQLFIVNGNQSNIEDFIKQPSLIQGQIQLVITGAFFEKYMQFNPSLLDQQQDHNKNRVVTEINQNDIERCIPDKRTDAFYSLILQYGRVFARMKPDQKQSLILLLQKYQNLKQDYSFIGMCGDGANDCQALKDADMGVSLGEAEASIAAPFTSKVMNISIIEYVLREGRCCLSTTFQCFKFMAIFCLIQGFVTTIMYQRGSIPADMQILFKDLCIIIPLTLFLGFTEATDKLTSQVPAHRLFSYNNILSVFGQALIQLAFAILIIGVAASQDWYYSPSQINNSKAEDTYMLDLSYDTTILFWVSNFQFVFVVVAFSIGSIHKKPFYTNIIFTFFLSCITTMCILVIFFEEPDFVEFFAIFSELKNNGEVISRMGISWKLVIFAMIIANGAVTILYEKYILNLLIQLFQKMFLKADYSNDSTTLLQTDFQSDQFSPSKPKEQNSQQLQL